MFKDKKQIRWFLPPFIFLLLFISINIWYNRNKAKQISASFFEEKSEEKSEMVEENSLPNNQITSSPENIDEVVSETRDEEASSLKPIQEKKKVLAVQVGAFKKKKNAEDLLKNLLSDALPAYIEETKRADTTWYKVRIGPYLKKKEAVEVLEKIRKKYPDSLVIETSPARQ